MKTCRKCGQTFTSTVIIDGRRRNLMKRIYCLNCSPFGERNRSILEKKMVIDGNDAKLCPMCNDFKIESDFYPKGTGLSSYCKTCTAIEHKLRQNRFKQQCVDYKGGQCESCGYKRSLAALDFHHTDPAEKDFLISEIRHCFEEAKSELDKCVLLCSNCHREHHEKEFFDKHSLKI